MESDLKIPADVLDQAEATKFNGMLDYPAVRRLVVSRRTSCRHIKSNGLLCSCSAYLQSGCGNHGGLTINQIVMEIYAELRRQGRLPPLPPIPKRT